MYILQKDCYSGYKEADHLLGEYVKGYSDLETFTDTFAYNFGLLYDSVITSMESISRGNYFLSGYSVGNLIYLIFFMA